MPYYQELDEIVRNIVGEKFLRNQNLCKLLKYYPDVETYNYDPYAQPDILDTSDLYMTHIIPAPKAPDATLDKGAYVTVVLTGGYEVERNNAYRKVNILIDIICHLDVWNIKGGYRPYRIMNEIDSMLNNQVTDLPIEGRPFLRGFQPRDYSNYFYGFQMIYEVVVNSNAVCNAEPILFRLGSEEPDVALSSSTS
jgi:hypothetical protein